MAPRQRERLGDGRVRHAAPLDHEKRTAARAGQDRRPDAGDPAADRPRTARRRGPDALGERTIIIDCDVLDADGGTRTASITGAAVALDAACQRLAREGQVRRIQCATRRRRQRWHSSNGEPLTRSRLSARTRGRRVDMNLVALEDGTMVEIQGTAEGQLRPARLIASSTSAPGDLRALRSAAGDRT